MRGGPGTGHVPTRDTVLGRGCACRLATMATVVAALLGEGIQVPMQVSVSAPSVHEAASRQDGRNVCFRHGRGRATHGRSPSPGRPVCPSPPSPCPVQPHCTASASGRPPEHGATYPCCGVTRRCFRLRRSRQMPSRAVRRFWTFLEMTCPFHQMRDENSFKKK